MAATGGQHRRLAHHPIAVDQMDRAVPIGDPPVAGQQLDGLVRPVLDPDMIDPEPLARRDLRLLRQERRRDPHGDPIGNGLMLKELMHARRLARIGGGGEMGVRGIS